MTADHSCSALVATASVSLLWIVAAPAALHAQAPPPFGPPQPAALFTLNGTGAVADVNRDGAVDVLSSGFFFGCLATSLDENGAALATNFSGPSFSAVPGAASLPTPVAMAAGDLDGDALADLVSVTSAGGVHVHKNHGASRLDACAFAGDVLIDNLLARWPVQPPFVNYSFPDAHVTDFDGDGLADILIAGGPLDRWAGATRPGFVGFYRQLAGGGFTAHRAMLTGCVIDMEVADLDRNGVLDTLVVVVETGSAGAFAVDVLHFAFVGGKLVSSAPPFSLAPGRCTAFALADIAGDSNLDYVFTHTLPSGSTTFGLVHWITGNGQGDLAGAVSGILPMPTNATPHGDFLPAVVAGDFDRDGHDDLAALRGFVTPVPNGSSAQPTWAPSEVLVAMGPNPTLSGFVPIALPGSQMFSSTHNNLFPLLPMQTQPGFLRTIDLAGDGSLDLLVLGLRQAAPGAPLLLAVLQNLTPPQIGDAGLHRLGQPSGGNPARPARLGFEGGPVRAGNSKFAATLLNVQGGSLAALAWGSVGIENLYVDHGVDVHIAPENYFGAQVVSGTGPGGGFARESLPIPYLPALAGYSGCFQWAYWDPVAGAYGGTHATSVTIAP